MHQIYDIVVYAIPLIFAITMHEAAHGWMATRYGDNTASMLGRVTLNPIPHIDLFGTIIVPGILLLGSVFTGLGGVLLGWAKPVPVNYNALRRRKRDIVLVAAAGIVTNLLLAAASSLFLQLTLWLPTTLFSGILAMFWLNMILFNIVLAVFNLLPIPPLDGSKILLGWSDNFYVQKFLNAERGGLIFIIVLAFVLPALLQTADISFNPFAIYLKQATLLLVGWLI